MLHQLKIEQHYLIHILEGNKTFEVRKNDRDFQKGDEIQFLPLESKNYDVYDHLKLPYNNVLPHYKITYVHQGLGLIDGYCVLGIEWIDGRKSSGK